MSFKKLTALVFCLYVLTLTALAASSIDYSNNTTVFPVGGNHAQSADYEVFRQQIHYQGLRSSSNYYRLESGFAHTDSANPLRISDPYVIIRSLSGSGSETNYSQRLRTLISKNTASISASVLVDHGVIPTPSFDAFNGVDVQIQRGPQGNTEISATGDLKAYLDTHFPGKYVTITIGDGGNDSSKIIYVRNDAGNRIQLTDPSGEKLAGLSATDSQRISNIVPVPGGYAFRVYKFSDYGLVTLNSIAWNQSSVVTGNAGSTRSISVKVLDSQGQTVSGAPVIFDHLMGNGTLSATAVSTNVSGDARVVFTFSTGIELNRVSASVDNLFTSPNLSLQTVDQPILIVSEYQIFSKTAPTSGGYGGNISDVVPGSKIVYSLKVINTGNGTANAVVVRETIPAHTAFFDIPLSGDVNENGGSLGSVGDVDYKVSGIYQANPPGVSANVQGLRFNVPPLGPSRNVVLRYSVTVD